MTADGGVLAARVERADALDAATREAWRALLLAQPLPAAFLGPTFADAVARSQGRARVCILEQDGRPVGFFPFQHASALDRLLGAAERIGEEMSDYAGIVLEGGRRIEPRRLLRLAGLQSYSFSHLEEQQARFGLVGEAPRIGLRIELPRGAAAFWEDRRRADVRFVRDTERRRRKAESDLGPLRFVLHEAEAGPALAHLIDRKRAQYARTGAGDSLSAPWKRALLEALLAAGEADCTAVMSTLHAGETWAASHFGLRCGGTLHFWFPVYNPDLSRYAPGRLLVAQIIEAADEAGITCIDRGEGDSPAKRDFANVEHGFSRGMWWRPGAGAAVSRVAQSLRWRLQALRAARPREAG